MEQVLATMARNGGQARVEWQRGVGQLLPILRDPLHRGAEDLSDGDAQERRCGVGSIVDIMREGSIGVPPPSVASCQSHRINIQQQRCRASIFGHLRIEDVGAAVGERKCLTLIWMLGEKVSQICRGSMSGLNCEQHAVNYSGLTRESCEWKDF